MRTPMRYFASPNDTLLGGLGCYAELSSLPFSDENRK